jgi:hypothetical protein
LTIQWHSKGCKPKTIYPKLESALGPILWLPTRPESLHYNLAFLALPEVPEGVFIVILMNDFSRVQAISFSQFAKVITNAKETAVHDSGSPVKSRLCLERLKKGSSQDLRRAEEDPARVGGLDAAISFIRRTPRPGLFPCRG